LVFSVALQGSAQTKAGGNRAAAEALFNQGRSLMTAGKFSEACPKFEASQQLDPGLGTMLNLAECYEKTGRTASAWAEYREAIPLARAAGSKARQELATERAKALEERLSTLTIRAMVSDDDNPHLEIRRDGVPVQRAELGSPIPVDPGEHVVEAVAPGKQPWSAKVQVGPDAAKVQVDVPQLENHDDGQARPEAAPVTSTSSANAPPADRPSSWSGQHTAAVVAAGAGVVGLGIGAFFGLQASSKWTDAKDACTNYPKGCDTRATDLAKSAKENATISNVGFIAGGALLATGAVLFFTAPSKKENVAFGFGAGSAFVKGSFQ
jgi:hypothetical protein